MMSVVACVEKPMNRTRPSFCSLRAASRQPFLLERPFEQLAVVDAVQRQQIHVIQPQIVHRRLERAREIPSAVAFGLTLVCTMILSRGSVGRMRPNCISDVP